MYSVGAWATLFLAIRGMFPKRSFDFCNRIVSTVHASLAVVLASLSVQDWSCPVCPLASKSSPNQMQALAVSVGYLIYDLVCCLFDKQVKLDNTVHHLVSIIGIVAGLAYQRCGSEMVAALCITEISSPFLHLRELLKELGYRASDINLAADISFAVIFTLARMIGGPYLTYVTLSAHNPLLIKAMALGLQLVSGFWFYKIAKMIMYKLSARVMCMTEVVRTTELVRQFEFILESLAWNIILLRPKAWRWFKCEPMTPTKTFVQLRWLNHEPLPPMVASVQRRWFKCGTMA
ncbi:TRAM protein [Perilla frutescens var. frutescens]|nr:TRAM protein [Perilla frutescens var. frutescens]